MKTRQITQYVAEDGKVFDSEERCREYEESNLSEERKLQVLCDEVHGLLCHWNHTDGCGYYYESWDRPGHAKNEEMKRVQRLMDAGFKDITAIRNIIKLL